MPPRDAHGSLPTSRDVAERAGVSQSTVSYVMSGRRAISAATRERVEAAMRDLDYHPNQGARALRAARTSVIAVVVHLDERVDGEETVPYLRGVSRAAASHGYDVLIDTGDDGAEGLRRLARRSVCDGFVMMDVRAHDDRLPVAEAIEQPVVLLGHPLDAGSLDAVDLDVRAAGSLLSDELADTGHALALVVGDDPDLDAEEYRFVAEFRRGTLERARARGLEADVLERPVRGRSGYGAVADLVAARAAGSRGPVGVVARTARATEELDLALRVRGLVPGRDVSLVSACTDSAATAFEDAVTNVSPEAEAVAAAAVERLVARLEGDDSAGGLRLLPPRSVTRRATTILR